MQLPITQPDNDNDDDDNDAILIMTTLRISSDQGYDDLPMTLHLMTLAVTSSIISPQY